MRGLHAMAHGIAAPAFVATPLTRGRPVAVLAGIGLALPLVVVLGLLLASADAVVAGFFDWWGSPEQVIVHAVLLGIGMWGMAGLLRLSSAEPAPAAPALPYRLGHVEATVVLGSLVALFTAFAIAQAIAAAGGARHVLETAGLTYAEYARQGFFQLMAVAAITVVALVGLRAVTDLSDPARRMRFTVLGEVAIALTLVILAVALRRLGLYTDAYGLTMLRLFSLVFTLWIGTVLVLAGVALAGVAADRAWLAGAALVAGLALLLGLNALNPEAMVARHNVERAARQLAVDPLYLAELSDDAVPALVDALPRLEDPERTAVLDAVCAGGDWPFDGWAAANTSRWRAMDARQRVCGPVGVRR
jgi:MFS family permease